MDDQVLTDIYTLSNSIPTVHYEKNIKHTALGILFNQTLRQTLDLDIVASYLAINREWISLSLKIRGQAGGHFGVISRYQENDISQIQNPFCFNVWQTFLNCAEQLNLPTLCFGEKDGAPYKLNIEVVDFEKCSRIGFFMDHIVELQRELRVRFPKVSFIIRFFDDDQYFYYLIFDDMQQQSLAEKIYGIQNMVNAIHEICRRDDEYRVFSNYRPNPMITDKVTLEKEGKVMGIMRNNTDFSSW